jgi:hypothetical protein
MPVPHTPSCCCQVIICCPAQLLEDYVSARATDADCESWYILTEYDEIILAENTDKLRQETANEFL